MNDQRRAELLAARAKRAEEAEKVKQAHEDLCLELEDKYCTEYGPRGEAWELINEENSCGEGPICIKTGDPTAHKLFMSKVPKNTAEDDLSYVVASVIYPERAKFNDIAFRRPQLLGRCAAAMTMLFGFSREVLAGKA